MHVERKNVSAVVTALVGLVIGGGCFVEGAEIEPRGGEHQLQSTEKIPGGGPCKRCIRGFRRTEHTLELCVDTRVEYIRTVAKEVVPLLELLNASTWVLVDGGEPPGSVNRCTGGACKAEVLGDPAGDFVTVAVQVAQNWQPESALLVIADYEGIVQGVASSIGQMPRIHLAPDNYSPCFGQKPPSFIGNKATFLKNPSSSPPFAAQIAFPWPTGGVRSCSGVVVSSRHILTAAHCFDHYLEYTELAPVEHVDVRLGMNSWLPSGSVADVILHPGYDASKIDSDLAIVELKSGAGPMAQRAKLPSHGPGVQSGDYRAVGYGVRKGLDTAEFDWGIVKDVKGLKLDLTLAGTEGLDQHLVVSHPNAYGLSLCQGDSGGPVLASVGGETDVVVGILAARLIDHDQCPDQDQPCSYTLETMNSAIAFNHGNACGEVEDARGYAATVIDDEVLTWIEMVIGAHPPLTK